jgi:hypothetical protein
MFVLEGGPEQLGDCSMEFALSRNERLCELQEQVRQAHAITSELMAKIILHACQRAQAHPAKARIFRAIEAQAPTDAVLALIELDIPQWNLRRLPVELDQTVDASHESLPLALLSAFLEIRCGPFTSAVRPRWVPQIGPVQPIPVCRDNFS